MSGFTAGYWRIRLSTGRTLVAWCVPTDSGRAVAAFRSQAAAKYPDRAIATYTLDQFAEVAIEAINPTAAG